MNLRTEDEFKYCPTGFSGGGECLEQYPDETNYHETAIRYQTHENEYSYEFKFRYNFGS